ncbi:hypothetical protein ABEZ87_10240 [Bacillus mycoides]|uniref:hypothetical protein n=1 Tax=Bacillus mycoides TaxID=1405 RepID=UPI003D1D6CC6
MKNKKYVKILTVIPLACMLSGPILTVAPIKTFAAENIQQEDIVQGYLLKNDVKIPIYKNANSKIKQFINGTEAPGFPELSPNPLEGAPKSGKSAIEFGDMGKVLYFQGDAPKGVLVDHIFPKDKIGKYYLQIKDDGSVVQGMYDPDTLELYEFVTVGGGGFSGNPNEQEKDYKQAFDGKTKIKRETDYNLLETSIQDNEAAYHFGKAITNGLTTTNVFSLAATAGVSVTAKLGGGILPMEMSTTLSESLTTSFQHSISVNNSTTTTHTYDVSVVDNPNYKYTKYQTAAYQLQSSYTVLPGDGLKQVLKENPEFKDLSSKLYTYKENELYFTMTPGSHKDHK